MKQPDTDSFIDPAVGADVSYHAIDWNAGRRPAAIPSGGNICYHSLPACGTEVHEQDYAEIIFVLQGAMIHHVNGESCRLKPGSVLFVRPNDAHSLAPEPGSEKERCEIVVLAFQLEMFLTLSQFFEDDSFLRRYTEPVTSPAFQFDIASLNELTGQLLALNSRQTSPGARKAKFKAVLADLFVRFFLEQPLSERQIPGWLRQLCEIMRKPENFIAGLKRLQQLSGYTPEYLCKAFRRYLDKSPTEFINELKINHAARRLADSDSPIAEIALELNFQSLSRFYHLFQNYYHTSPSRYRARAASRRLV